MNSLILLLAGLGVFVLGYRFYSAFISAKILVFDKNRKTPANELNNGFDHVPTNKYVLFGHHFASIAGAGPLIGPVLAAQFGFLPGAIWIIFGAVLAGAVHDMVILFASVRHNGEALHTLAFRYIGKVSSITTAIATLFIMITALAGLGIAVVNSMSESPWATFTIFFTMPVAIFVGIYMKFLRVEKIREASIIGISLVVLGVAIGHWVAQGSLAPFFTLSKNQLSLFLPIYGFFASVLPVWLLLAPRDYLSSYMKIGTIFILALGIFIVRPFLHMPAITEYIKGGGPVIPGKLWPYVFITIACGAISGFHSLVSTGTTPKMVKNEMDIRFIGYGAMIMEGFVALMALIAATVLKPADYFAINVPKEVFQNLGMIPENIQYLSQMVGEDVMGRTGGAVSLAVGMAYIFSSIPGFKGLMSYWYHFAIMFEALFILTTIDTGTRIGRYILQESFGTIIKPFKNFNWVPGIIITSALMSIAWGYLLYFGSITTIWPMFGVSNQLLSVIALVIGTTFILKMSSKKMYGLITFIPFLFMFSVTFTAGILNIVNIYLPSKSATGKVNLFLTIIMLILVLIISIDGIRNWIKILKIKSQ